MEQFGWMAFNNHEEMLVSLKEVCRTWHVEFRVCDRSDASLDPIPRARSIINLPIAQLPMLLERLTQLRDSCLKRGLLGGDAGREMVVMNGGETVTAREHSRVHGDRGRRQPRVAVRYPVICQTERTKDSPRSATLRGEFRDLSPGGAQVWLPVRLDLGQLVEIAAVLDGQPFRARAEVVGAALQAGQGAGGGLIRHNLKWINYSAAAADVLTRILLRATRGKPTQGDSPSRAVTPGGQAAAALVGN